MDMYVKRIYINILKYGLEPSILKREGMGYTYIKGIHSSSDLDDCMKQENIFCWFKRICILI
jgi:hypothetical protein